MNNHEQMLFHTYFAFIWWQESIKSDFFQSDFFKKMEFQDSFVKNNLKDFGVAQGALLLPSLYVCLLIPKETIFSEHATEFNEIDLKFAEKLTITENTYPSSPIKVIKHLRNALAHSKLHLINDGVEFSDCDTRNGSKLTASISLTDVSELISELQKIILSHVKVVQDKH